MFAMSFKISEGILYSYYSLLKNADEIAIEFIIIVILRPDNFGS